MTDSSVAEGWHEVKTIHQNDTRGANGKRGGGQIGKLVSERGMWYHSVAA